LQMIYCNFWFLKSTNGMAYYGLDYVNSMLEMGDEIVLIKRVGVNLPISEKTNLKIHDVNSWQFLNIYLKMLISRSIVYCPTPHALPFLYRQIITLHDAYPFLKPGLKRKINTIIFKFMLLNKNIFVVTINMSIRKKLIEYKIQNYIYAPNFISLKGGQKTSKIHNEKGRVRVGLVGTDSRKKDYETLFKIIRLKKLSSKKYSFHIFGEFNGYIKRLMQQFADVDIFYGI
jgi:glycosyltransferase involved in cell wall biosynthesis